jgi:hypothetical protein
VAPRSGRAGGRPEIYVSTDVESDGPIPGPHSMLSFGSAAYDEAGGLLGTFSANLETLQGANADPETARWWQSQPEAYAACRIDPRPPTAVMPEYAAWVRALPGTPVFVGFPAGYDFLFIYWYLMRFVGQSPYSHSALDMKTLGMALLGGGYRGVTLDRLRARWPTTRAHTHVALDDALEQGELFCAMLRAVREGG